MYPYVAWQAKRRKGDQERLPTRARKPKQKEKDWHTEANLAKKCAKMRSSDVCEEPSHPIVHLGGILGTSWRVFAVSWGTLWGSWGLLWHLLGGLWGVLGAIWVSKCAQNCSPSEPNEYKFASQTHCFFSRVSNAFWNGFLKRFCLTRASAGMPQSCELYRFLLVFNKSPFLRTSRFTRATERENIIKKMWKNGRKRTKY